MPTLKRARKEQIRRINRDNRNEIYQSKRWKELRLVKLANSPLCEICLSNDKIEPAIDIHHRDSLTNYTGNLRITKAYDYNNLLSVCK